jgi:hypothetical protein
MAASIIYILTSEHHNVDAGRVGQGWALLACANTQILRPEVEMLSVTATTRDISFRVVAIIAGIRRRLVSARETVVERQW